MSAFLETIAADARARAKSELSGMVSVVRREAARQLEKAGLHCRIDASTLLAIGAGPWSGIAGASLEEWSERIRSKLEERYATEMLDALAKVEP